jgi:hypothetical protein
MFLSFSSSIRWRDPQCWAKIFASPVTLPHRQELDGRAITVNNARQRVAYNNNGGGGDGGDGGGGGME